MVQLRVMSISDATSDKSPNPMESVNTHLSFYANLGSLGRGSMRNASTSAGGKAVSQTGAWGYQKSRDTSKKQAVVGAAYYSAAQKYRLLYVTMGVSADLLGSSGCTNQQIVAQSGVVRRVLSVFTIS